MAAKNIGQVLDALDKILDDSERNKDRIGYFAALYRKFTSAVRDSIHRNEFLDGDRMERMDVTFANRYFDALDAYRAGRPLTQSWRVSFDACKLREPTVLQHLYVGLAAHQLFDLAIAAAEIAPGQMLSDLRGDFDHINSIAARLMREVDETIGKISPWIGVLDRVAGVPYATMNKVGIFVAREIAWRAANDLSAMPSGARDGHIDTMDKRTALVGRAIVKPGAGVGLLARVIRARESDDVTKTIRALRG